MSIIGQDFQTFILKYSRIANNKNVYDDEIVQRAETVRSTGSRG
jgi:hypothetical protein